MSDNKTLCDYCGKELHRPIYSCCQFSFCLDCLYEHYRTLHPGITLWEGARE